MLNDAGVGAEMMKVMSESLCLVKECQELEEGFGRSFTDELLSGADSTLDFRHVRKEIRKIDSEIMTCNFLGGALREIELGNDV